MKKGFIEANFLLLAIACIVEAGILVYGQTLSVPWYFDDISGILESGAIRDLGQATRNILAPGRGLVLWTFALNYHFGGFEVIGYHFINIVIHMASAAMVLLILRRIFSPGSWFPLLGALLFLVHPIQTEAVTYIIQRMTSLSGLCLFLSLFLYILARDELARTGQLLAWRHSLFYLAALLTGATAVLIKENAAVLPVIIFLFDSYFLPRTGLESWKKQLLYLLPFVLVPLGLAMHKLLLPMLQGTEVLDIVGIQPTANLNHLSSLNYLATEFSVIWLYIRLLFLPYGQALDYSYPVVATLLTTKTLLALVGCMGLLGAALLWRRTAPLISFGIFWFFLTLAVESSLIPLDPVFEHRLYVPLFGFVLVLIGLLQRLLPLRRAEIVLLCLIPLLAIVAWQRNALWKDPIAFYEDNLRRAPWSERVNSNLAQEYISVGRYDEALPVLLQAKAINPNLSGIYVNLALVYMAREDYTQALAALQNGLQINPNGKKLLLNLAVTYKKLGQPAIAIGYLQRAILLDPGYALAHFYLGELQEKTGQPLLAIDSYERAISFFQTDHREHDNLKVARYRREELRRAQGQ